MNSEPKGMDYVEIAGCSFTQSVHEQCRRVSYRGLFGAKNACTYSVACLDDDFSLDELRFGSSYLSLRTFPLIQVRNE